jgi:hypothetical protein
MCGAWVAQLPVMPLLPLAAQLRLMNVCKQLGHGRDQGQHERRFDDTLCWRHCLAITIAEHPRNWQAVLGSNQPPNDDETAKARLSGTFQNSRVFVNQLLTSPNSPSNTGTKLSPVLGGLRHKWPTAPACFAQPKRLLKLHVGTFVTRIKVAQGGSLQARRFSQGGVQFCWRNSHEGSTRAMP